MKIITEHVYPPIPDRRFDWAATLDGYEPGDPHGEGPTENAAVADLLAALGCKDCGGDVGTRGECLICSAEAGVVCRGREEPAPIAIRRALTERFEARIRESEGS